MLHWLVPPNDLTLEPFGNRLASITDWGYMRGNNVMSNEKYNVRTFYLETGGEISHYLIYRSVAQITYMSKCHCLQSRSENCYITMRSIQLFISGLNIQTAFQHYPIHLCLFPANSQTQSENGPK